MPDYQAPLRDMRFVLHELFEAESVWQKLRPPSEPTRELADAVLDEAARINEELLAPLMRSSDEAGARWAQGQVFAPDGFREAYATIGEGGWVGLGGNPALGGQGMPKMLSVMYEEMLSSASCAFGLYAILSSGGAMLLDAHASEEQKRQLLPPVYSGRWTIAMCLTEAHAGSDLGLIRTRAEPQPDGSYALSGTKIFITAGDHDLTDNILHLVLARLPDAPAGTRGISLFVVPKFAINADGSLDTRQQYSCGSLEEKMGIHGSATCVIHYDGAKGILVGEPGRGLNYMFTMMNYERLSVGLQGLGCAERSRQVALNYARERLQGRAAGPRDDSPADPIIVHGDVRRMLLTQKAYTEAGRAFATFVGMQLDIAKYGTGEEQARGETLGALLTPVAKAFMTDLGLELCVAGQQVLGGHGYVREWGVEQLVRDVRITQIYEGTNGIQALDLLGRKIVATEGRDALLLFDLIRDWCAGQQIDAMREFVGPVLHTLDRLQSLTLWLLGEAKRDPHAVNGSAVEYLHAFGHVVYAYLWARMAAVALARDPEGNDGFYRAKRQTARFYMQRLLPRFNALADSVGAGASSLMELAESDF